MKYPSREPPPIPEYYAACHFPETMPDVVNIADPIQGMLSHAAMMSSRKKAQRLSAYEADPINCPVKLPVYPRVAVTDPVTSNPLGKFKLPVM